MPTRTLIILVLLLAIVGGGTALAIRTNASGEPGTFEVADAFTLDITSEWSETTVQAPTPAPREPGEAELRPLLVYSHPGDRTIGIFQDDSGDDMEALVEAWADLTLGEPEIHQDYREGLDVWFLSDADTTPGRIGSVHVAVVRLDTEPSLAWVVSCGAREPHDEECPRVLDSIRIAR